MTLSDKLYKILIQGGSWKTILGGLWVTVQISAFALILRAALGAADRGQAEAARTLGFNAWSIKSTTVFTKDFKSQTITS